MSSRKGILLSLDLSIACTGLCIFDVDNEKLLEHHIIPLKKATKKKYKGMYNVGVEEEDYRSFYNDPEKFHFISENILKYTEPYREDIKWICKESYAFGGSSLSRLAEQSGVCLYRLWKEQFIDFSNLITIAPVSVKKVATGSGNATKKEVMAGVHKRWGYSPEFWYSSDDCDAFVIGSIGMMVVNNSPVNKYEKELREKIIKNNSLNLEK